MELTKEDMRLGCLYLHRRRIEMTPAQLISEKYLDQDIIVRKLRWADKPAPDSDREFFRLLQKRRLPL